MRFKRLRRRLHAERAPKRRNIVDEDVGANGDNLVNIPVGGFTLTGPITLTIISTLPSTSTPSSTSAVGTSSTAQSTALLSSPSASALTSSSASSQAPTSSSTSASTPVPSIILPSVTSTGSSEQKQRASDLSAAKIPAGGIAGIVIGCLIVLAAALFFLMRSRFRRGRMKLRNTWTQNSPVGISSDSFDPKPFVGDSVPPNMSPEMKFATRSPARQFQSSPLAISVPLSGTMALPAQSYNNADPLTPQSVVPTRNTRILSPTSVSSLTSAMTSTSSATVICTFIVSLPDELSIQVGETVRILAEYDDGWVLCMNADGDQGMVPLECLSRGRLMTSGDGGSTPPNLDRDARGLRRVSSLTPSAPVLKVYNP